MISSMLMTFGLDSTPSSICVRCSPVRKMLRFKAGDRHSPIANSNVESPYSVSPIGQDVQGRLSPKLTQRKIARSPFKVYSAPLIGLLTCSLTLLKLNAALIPWTNSNPNIRDVLPCLADAGRLSLDYTFSMLKE